MTKSSRVMIGILGFAVWALAGTSWAQSRPPILEKIAKTYGVDSWDQIEAIRYTWNGEITGMFKISRTWEWEPKTGKVSYEGPDKEGKPVKISYMRSEIGDDPVKKQTDAGFTNDNYWVLFPFHAYWDTSATVVDQGMFNLPRGSGMAELVPVKYSGDTGYTPGDTWDLYVGKDNRVVYLDYHRAGSKPPSRALATWTGYKKAGPLLISTEHSGTADGKPLHVFFTNVAVKVTGSDKWIDAK
jgi:hypothetical protein